MDNTFRHQYIPYSETGEFTKILLDYIDQSPLLRDFYEHPVDIEGIQSAITQRKKFNTNRRLLVDRLTHQYEGMEKGDHINDQIHSLMSEDTFTVCTAHQPNLFTGHLYFVYKILHAVRLAESFNKQLPQYHFVPVFFMGSEDADLAELNHIVLDGRKYEWQTSQTGAVGRMKVDRNLIGLIEAISGRLSVETFGNTLIDLLKKCFIEGSTMEEATFLLVHHLFREFGLLVLLPDHDDYKREMIPIFEEDIFSHRSSEIVNETSLRLSKHYRAQAYPREINLFYLKDDIRNRIVPVEDHYVVHGTEIVFTKEEIQEELRQYPRRFSPNVILRGLFQEVILPDVAWIGGGGELAYWLQLKDLFNYYQVPYPVLVVRNSFLLIDQKDQSLLQRLGLRGASLFLGREALLNEIINRESSSRLTLNDQKAAFEKLYRHIGERVSSIDPTLVVHTAALEARQRKTMDSLEKKMLRAEKRKFTDQKNQLERLFSGLFPQEGLQERTENFMLFYSRWGSDFFRILYEHSLALEQEFCVLQQDAILKGG